MESLSAPHFIKIFFASLSNTRQGHKERSDILKLIFLIYRSRVIFMEEHIHIRPDGSLLLGRQTSEWSL